MTTRKENSENTICYRKRKIRKPSYIEKMNPEQKKQYYQSQSRTLSLLKPKPKEFISPLLTDKSVCTEGVQNVNYEDQDEDENEDDNSDTELDHNVNNIDSPDAVVQPKSTSSKRSLSASNTPNEEDNDCNDDFLSGMKERLAELKKDYTEQNDLYTEVQFQRDVIAKKVKHVEAAVKAYSKSLN